MADWDYLDDELALRLAYEVRARDALLSGIKNYQPYVTYMEFQNGKSIKLNEYLNRKNIQKAINYDQQLNKTGFQHSWQIIKVFNDDLFNVNLEQPVITLKSEVVACKRRTDRKFSYIIRWHPEGM